MTQLKFSVLDLTPVPSGMTPGQAIENSVALARVADTLGYHRYWLAEHHNMAMLACSVPELLIARIGAETRRIRLGAGGIMLPNHSALHVAESFRVLEAMYPGRIDLGLGRAPGTDGRTALALRRGEAANGDEDFIRQLTDLVDYLGEGLPGGHRSAVAASPMGVAMPPLWMLGSTYYGAQVAAANGLGFAFAHHINPEPARDALRLYRERFQATEFGDEPRAILALHVLCAESDAEAEILAYVTDAAILKILTGDTRSPYPSRAEALAHQFTAQEEMMRPTRAGRAKAGTPAVLRDYILELAESTGADEVILTTLVGDHEARVKSYTLLAAALGLQP